MSMYKEAASKFGGALALLRNKNVIDGAIKGAAGTAALGAAGFAGAGIGRKTLKKDFNEFNKLENQAIAKEFAQRGALAYRDQLLSNLKRRQGNV